MTLAVLVDAVIALTLLEAALLFVWRRGLARALLPTLLAGLCLMLAVRAAVQGGCTVCVLAALAAAGIAHAVDLWLRARGAVR